MSPFGRDVSTTLTTKVLVSALGLLSGVLVARTLGPEGHGVYAAVVALASMVLVVGSLGIGRAAVFELGRRCHPAPKVVATTFLLGVCGALVVSTAIACIGWLGAGGLLREVKLHVVLASLPMAVVGLMMSHGESLLRGQGRIPLCNVGALSSSAAFLAVVGLLSLWQVHNPMWFLLGRALGTLTALLIFLWGLQVTSVWQSGADGKLAVAMTRYGVVFTIYSALMILTYRFDVLMINFLAGGAATGFYAAAIALSEVVLLVPSAVVFVSFPRAARSTEAVSVEETARICRTGLALLVPVVAVLGLLAPWVVAGVLGEAFLPAASPMRILVLGTLALFVFQILAGHAAGRGQQAQLATQAGLAFGLNIGLNLLWIPRYGIDGAAWASVAAYIFLAVTGGMLFLRRYHRGIGDLLCIGRVDVRWLAGKVRGITIPAGSQP